MGTVLRMALVALTVVGFGCPRDLAVPEPPAGIQRCDASADCNRTTCGVLRACVGGLCEGPDAGTLAVPCRDGGMPDAMAGDAPLDGAPEVGP